LSQIKGYLNRNCWNVFSAKRIKREMPVRDRVSEMLRVASRRTAVLAAAGTGRPSTL
jgi:hypothetical protein